MLTFKNTLQLTKLITTCIELYNSHAYYESNKQYSDLDVEIMTLNSTIVLNYNNIHILSISRSINGDTQMAINNIPSVINIHTPYDGCYRSVNNTGLVFDDVSTISNELPVYPVLDNDEFDCASFQLSTSNYNDMVCSALLLRPYVTEKLEKMYNAYKISIYTHHNEWDMLDFDLIHNSILNIKKNGIFTDF